MRHEQGISPDVSPVRVKLENAQGRVALNYQEDAAEFDGMAGHLKNGMVPILFSADFQLQQFRLLMRTPTPIQPRIHPRAIVVQPIALMPFHLIFFATLDD